MIGSVHMQTLEHYLDMLAMRQAVIAGNLANVDTPGYRTRDLDFAAEVHRAVTGESVSGNVREVRGLLERPDGNNVSVDRESLLLADTQLRFRLATQLLRTEFQRLKTAIHEGR